MESNGDETWLQKIFEGSSKKRIVYCKNKDGILSGGIPIEPDLMGYVKIPRNWKRYIFHRGLSWNIESFFGKMTDFSRKGEGQSPSSRLSNTNESFCDDPVLGQGTIMYRVFRQSAVCASLAGVPTPRGYDTHAADVGLTRARHRGCGPK